MINRLSGFAILFLILLFHFEIFSDLLFDDDVPMKLRTGISDIYRRKNIKSSYLIEIQDENNLLIIAENGFLKRVPIADITPEDVINLMEEMVNPSFVKKKEEINLIDETVRDIKSVKTFDPELDKEKEKKSYLKGGIKITDNIEFFPWTQSNQRFNISFFVSSEENWAGGASSNVGLAFLKLGLCIKKGSNIIFDEEEKVSWESYGVNIQFDLFSAYNFFISAGFEVSLYRAKKKLFEREFFIFKAGYRYKWFEMSAAINVSPTVIELGLFGNKYTMERYNFVISAGFLF